MSHEFQTILFLKTSLLKPNQNSEELSFHINLATDSLFFILECVYF